ncbi:MAG: hypothetical protein WBG46_07685 [Nonlabens sp.]
MIILKYLIYYTYIGLYEFFLATRRITSKTQKALQQWNTVRDKSGEPKVLRTTLLRTAFRSIL